MTVEHMHFNIGGATVLLTKRADGVEGPSFGLTVNDGPLDLEKLISGAEDEAAYFSASAMRVIAHAILDLTDD